MTESEFQVELDGLRKAGMPEELVTGLYHLWIAKRREEEAPAEPEVNPGRLRQLVRKILRQDGNQS